MPYNECNELLLERYVLGELSEEKMAEIETMENRDSLLRGRIEKLRNENREFIEKYPPETFVADLNIESKETKTEKKTGSRYLMRFAVPVFAVALLVVLMPWEMFQKNRSGNIMNPLTGDITRTKGNVSAPAMNSQALIVYRKTSSGTEELQSGDFAGEGDRLQIAYQAGGSSHGIIVSVDGNGVLTHHYPSELSGVMVLKKGRRTLLASSYELDDAPDFERFFFITSDSRENLEKLVKEIEQLKMKADKIDDVDQFFVDKGCNCTSITIMKR